MILIVIFTIVIFQHQLQLQKTKSRLIWISIDSVRSDLFKTKDFNYLEGFANKGVHAKKLHPVFPTETFPNLFSAVTGLSVEEHGVVADQIIDKEIGFLDYKYVGKKWWDPKNETLPIWTLVEKNGGKAAVIYWPGADVKFGGTYPTFYHRIYDHFCGVECRLNEALQYVQDETYDLIMVYISDYVQTCHKYGPDTDDAKATMSYIDESIHYFIEKTKETKDFHETSIMISGDHGISTVSNDKILVANDILGTYNGHAMVFDGPVGMFNCYKARCDDIINSLKKLDHVRFAGYNSQLPKEFHFVRNKHIPDVIVIMEEGWMIKQTHQNYDAGNHGYPWQWVDSMNTKFIGFNGKFKQGIELESLDMTDLFYIACKTLDLQNNCQKKRNLPKGIFKTGSSYSSVPSIIAISIVVTLMILLAIIYYRIRNPNNFHLLV